MPNFDVLSLKGLLSTPLVLPAAFAGAVAALLLVLLVLAFRRASPIGLPRVLAAIVALSLFALAAMALLDRLAINDRAAERRALLARETELTARAIAPGSMLSCLDGGAGETVENVCEKAVFADAQSAAGAVAYMGARLTLLANAADFAQANDPGLLEAFAAVRRGIELDRYGIAAHVLSALDGCTAERCPAFALLRDTGALKANLKVHAFDNYVARYVDVWNKTAPVAEKSAPAPVASASEPAKNPVSSRYDFPSADSIPPVSIMNSEPPSPKEAAAPAAVDNAAKPQAPAKRPQKQAAEPATR